MATSLLRAGMYAIGWDFGVQLRFGRRERTRARRREPNTARPTRYLAADGKGFWLICLEADRHWPNLVVALDRPDLAADPRFADASSRLANSIELVAVLDEVFATRPYAEWAERFDATDVWYSPINSIVDVIADPQVIGVGSDRRDDAARRRGAVSRDRLTGRLRPPPRSARARCRSSASTPTRC